MKKNIAKYLVAAQLIAVVIFIDGSAPALAISLSEALTRARRGDPSFLGARAQLDAAQERGHYARSNLLPQITANANTQQNERLYVTRTTPESRFDESFNSNSAQINLTQALWRTANYAALSQANAATAQAEQLLIAAEQDLLARLVQAWFDTMYARDHLIYTQGQVATSSLELAQTTHAVTLGLLAQPGTCNSGTADFTGAINAQWFEYPAPCSIHLRSNSFWISKSGFLLLGGGMR